MEVNSKFENQPGAVVVIPWQLDLQLRSCEFKPRSWRSVLDITLCDKNFL